VDNNEGKIQEALESGVSAEDMGLDTTDLSYHLPDEEFQGDTAQKAPDLTPKNAEPVPPGTPDSVARVFRAIPHEKIRKARAIYDRFDQKDMSFCDFAIEYAWASSPAAMNADLEKIMDQKHRGMARKQAIDSIMKPN
jgi:hypothetical protein